MLARGACRRVPPSMIYLLFISIFCNVYVEIMLRRVGFVFIKICVVQSALIV